MPRELPGQGGSLYDKVAGGSDGRVNSCSRTDKNNARLTADKAEVDKFDKLTFPAHKQV